MDLYIRLLLIICLVTMGGCASQAASRADSQADTQRNDDPWEPFNRKVFAFNETLDRYLTKPAARGYRKVTPGWLDDGITRVFENLRDLRSAANSLLQWEWPQTGENFGRFVVNSTLGVGGFFDVASQAEIRKTPEDFGLTLADWGVARGNYLVLPFLGPSTVRATFGEVPDYFLWAPNYIGHQPTEYSITAVRVVDLRAGLLDVERGVVGDRYTFLRNAYLQGRAYQSGEAAPRDDFGDGFQESDDDW
jgi:phospholipid-binding lipoprotein MlaA